MKTVCYIFLLITTFVSCKNDDKKPARNGILLGRWKLVEYWSYQEGGELGKFEPIRDEGFSSILEFSSNGDFSEKKGILYSSFNPCDTYTLLDSNRIELTVRKDPSYKTIWTISSVTADTLLLGFQGCERCLQKYIAIR